MDRLRVAVADAGASAPAGSSVPAGTAYFTVRRGLLSTSFRYDDSYLASAGAYPIDPGWPLLDGGHHAAGRVRRLRFTEVRGEPLPFHP